MTPTYQGLSLYRKIRKAEFVIVFVSVIVHRCASDKLTPVAAILRSTVIGSQSVKGYEGFKPIILFICCHVRSASFIIFARVESAKLSK